MRRRLCARLFCRLLRRSLVFLEKMSNFVDSRESPMSDAASESGFGTLSLRDKSLIKRNINKHHNNNFKAGYVPVHEQSLHKTGLRGRKTYAFWVLVMLLFFLAMANLILTFVILGVLRLGQGMESLELVPDEALVMFYGQTDLDRVYKRDGKLEGFDECPVEVVGDDGPVLINLKDSYTHTDPKITVDSDQTTISGVNSFEVKDPETGNLVFSTGFPNFGLPNGVGQLNVKMARTHRVTSPVDKSLSLVADTYAQLRGNEGTHIEGKEIIWSADQDIFLKSVNGSVILNGTDGISLNIKNIPIAESTDETQPVSAHFKVCVCMPSGKLFRVPVPPGKSNQIGCHHANSAISNPCV